MKRPASTAAPTAALPADTTCDSARAADDRAVAITLDTHTADAALLETSAWVDHAVIGLNLCPFAKAVQVKRQIRYVRSEATTTAALRADLVAELQHLAATPPELTDTTVLVHPQVLQAFLDFNDFLAEADAAVAGLGLDGVVQVAAFHPQFQFAGTADDDITNATNRAPYPTLHLIREASIDRAVAAFPEAEAIYELNMATLEALGAEGWAAVQQRCRADAARASYAGPGPRPDPGLTAPLKA